MGPWPNGEGSRLISERCEGSTPSGPTDRYDVEIIWADGTEDQQRWIPFSQVLVTLQAMADGDDVVIHHVGYAPPEVIYG